MIARPSFGVPLLVRINQSMSQASPDILGASSWSIGVAQFDALQTWHVVGRGHFVQTLSSTMK